MPDEKETDEELIEGVRRRMQESRDRAFDAFEQGTSVDGFFASEEAQGYEEGVAVVLLDKLREVGSFLLNYPAHVPPFFPRRHWVYEQLSDGAIFVLSLKVREQLRRLGYARVPVLKHDPRRGN